MWNFFLPPLLEYPATTTTDLRHAFLAARRVRARRNWPTNVRPVLDKVSHYYATRSRFAGSDRLPRRSRPGGGAGSIVWSEGAEEDRMKRTDVTIRFGRQCLEIGRGGLIGDCHG